jgi:hypothetical protein
MAKKKFQISHHYLGEVQMNRREMLAAGFRKLARAVPGLVTKKNLGPWLTGSLAGTRPPSEVLSFPKKSKEPAPQGPEPFKKD